MEFCSRYDICVIWLIKLDIYLKYSPIASQYGDILKYISAGIKAITSIKQNIIHAKWERHIDFKHGLSYESG